MLARLAAVGLLALTALTTQALGEPFTGTRNIDLEDTVSAEFTGSPGEVHEFTFFAVEGTIVDATVKGASGSARPHLRLTRPGGEVLRNGGKRIRNFRAPYSANFVLQVTPRAGTAAYTLNTGRRKNPRRVEALRRAGPEGTFRFYAAAFSTFEVKIREIPRRRKRPFPEVVGITGPDGADVPIFPRREGDTGTMNPVVLSLQGEYVLAWANPGHLRNLRFIFDTRAPKPPKTQHILGAATGLPPTTPDTAIPALPAREGYVGSAACGSCHDDYYLAWSSSVHNLAVREWNRAGKTGVPFANDANGNDRDDFVDGRDLAGDPAFAQFGADAPKLQFADGETLPYRVVIGAATYDVERTVGGNGLWTQQYLARIGRSLYVLPVQYDERAGSYIAYEPDDWYDDEDAARFADPSQVPPDLSFEAKCSGCHSTGLVLEVDSSSGEFLSGFVESSVGCEQCHGPGAEHAATGNPAFVSNPRGLIDGTPEGVGAANQVCGRCHTRGEAVDLFPGTQVRAPFGYRQDSGVQHYGDAAADFLTPSEDDADFWARKEDPMSALPGDTFVAPRRYGLQSTGIDSGPHGATESFSASCFDCHDPHGFGGSHQIRAWVDRGVRVTTKAEDNSLCLACHAGVPGPFESVPKEDAARIAEEGAPPSVVFATTDHMKDVGMGVSVFAYDPEGSGAGNCVTCHMPRTAAAGAFGTDPAGHLTGDHASHTFDVVWPNAGVNHDVTNSCSACHPTDAQDRAAAIIAEWASPDRDGDSTFHADTPRSFQNGIRNEHRNGGVRCAKCHTTDGFLRIEVGGEELDQDEIDHIVKKGLAREAGVTCRACHGRQPDGTFASGRNPLRYPKAELCGHCHNNATVVFADFRDEGETVSHPQREMIGGTAGSEVPGSGGYADTAHSNPGLFTGGCVDCHFDTNGGRRGHDFQPSVEDCRGCHRGLDSFDRPAKGDYDGNGSIEGIQTEVDGLLAVVEAALVADPQITYDGRRFQYGGATDGKMTGASDAQKRAAFNHYSVDSDGSRGIHNAARAVQLLQRSYEEVTGMPVPGADLR